MQYSLLFHCNNGCTNAPRCYVTRTLPGLFCTKECRPGTGLWHYHYYTRIHLYIFTYGSTNNTVESLSTNETAQRSSQRIRSWFLPDSSGTNRTPADPLGPSTSTIPEFFFSDSVLLAEGSTLDPCNTSRRPELDARKGHAYLLPTVSTGRPSLCNGQATISPRVSLSHGV